MKLGQSSWRAALYESAPFQIALLHFKKNHFILLSWVLFSLIFIRSIGNVLGVPYLFLSPEYLHQVNFLSFSLLGAAIGLFSLVFQIITYILYASRFPFFGLLKRPFLKFSVNNSFFPLLFHGFFVCAMLSFQRGQSTKTIDMLEYTGGYLAGVFFVILFFWWYFYLVDRGPLENFSEKINRGLRQTILAKIRAIAQLREAKKEKGKERYFLTERFALKNTRQYPSRYDKKALLRVFDKNHLNVLLVGIMLSFLLIFFGKFIDNHYFHFPAAVNFVLLFTLFFMLMGSVYYWLGEWHIILLLIAFVFWGLFGERLDVLRSYRAMGIDYQHTQSYDILSVNENIAAHVTEDKQRTLEILTNWHNKFVSADKPPMVLICVSGGGLCASLFTLHALQAVDARLQKSIMHYTMLITGASGGMLGAAYYRALYHEHARGESIDMSSNTWGENIAKDKLNPMLLSLLVDDIFSFSRGKITYRGQVYTKDRGYAWEEKVNKDTQGMLNGTMADYRAAEYQAEIPMIILSPTIVNSGAKLYISSQGVSYMPYLQQTYSRTPPNAGIDFHAFFEENHSSSLRFLTALRMNSTFPYIMPYVSLPTEPVIQVMDAGMHDNFGIQDALKFLYTFEAWMEQHVSSIIFLVVRSNPSGDVVEGRALGPFSWLTEPIALLYKNIPSMQSIANYQQLARWRAQTSLPVEFVYLSYEPPRMSSAAENTRDNQDISLSWHLTPLEKKKVTESLKTNRNQRALEKIARALPRAPHGRKEPSSIKKE